MSKPRSAAGSAARAAKTAAVAAGQAADAAVVAAEAAAPGGRPGDEVELELGSEYEAFESPWAAHFRRARPTGDDFGHEVVIVRKKSPLPAWASGHAIEVHTFDDPYAFPSLENEVKRLARENGWGSGLYRFEARDAKSNRIVEPGVYEAPVLLDGDAAALAPGGLGGPFAPPAAAASAPTLGVKDVFEVADKIKGPPAPSIAEELAKLKAAGLMPEGVQVEKWIPLATTLLAGLKEVFARPADPVQTALLQKMLTPDPVQTALMSKLVERALEPPKTVGGVGEKLLGKIVDVALDGGLGGGSGERSVWGEVKDLLVGTLETEAGVNFSAAVRDGASAIKHRIVGGQPAPPAPGAATPAASGAVAALQAELARAAVSSDQRYFHTFISRVRSMFPQAGPQIIDGIATGQITDDVALTQLQSAGIQLTAPVTTYLRTLMNWLRYTHRRGQAPAPPASPPASSNGAPLSGQVGRCAGCGAMYEGDAESFAQPCDSCGGQVSPVVAAS